MDRSKTIAGNYDRGGKIHLETPHMQVLPHMHHCHGQQHQFKAHTYDDFLTRLGIKHLVTSVEHPHTNGQVEAANRVILRALRTRLEKSKGLWKEELPNILWAYHCSPQITINETPYRLIYGTGAMIPIEVGEPSTRRLLFQQQGPVARLHSYKYQVSLNP